MSSNESLDPRLAAIGWSSFFASSLESLDDPSLVPARVGEEHRGLWRVISPLGDLTAELAGRLRHEAAGRDALPAVGDWVAVEARPTEGRATIRHVLPRRSALIRKAAGTRTDAQVVAANVDVVFIVTAAVQDFDAGRLARYLTPAWESGATPVVLLTKCDLADDVARVLGEATAAAPGADVHAISAVDGRGLDALGSYLAPGRTLALVGSSGVGKSTLVNRLLGEERLAVATVREHDGRGRHTTTSRQMIALPSGALVIDTPGMRELGLWAAGDSVVVAFGDIEEIAAGCRFRDCLHASEPGCAVRAAIEKGALATERLAQWNLLRREAAFQARKQDARVMADEKRRWKAVSKLIRERDRMLGTKRTGIE